MNQAIAQQVTPKQMLLAINDHSKNEVSRLLARKILLGKTTIEEEIGRSHGRFMTAVLKGDFNTALSVADSTNEAALKTLIQQDGYCNNGTDCGCTAVSHRSCFIEY